jgi:hypothetical protein
VGKRENARKIAVDLPDTPRKPVIEFCFYMAHPMPNLNRFFENRKMAE